ncbi:hypothetical protein BXZ70DRAFT_1007369 [Cristinia sonorae]|uniref:Uncharacterized protein n=1 Tax=Cristinia sonorae TaxID=1940300 RepID=A0A8K0UPI4_9AGAR|nr:hypothetical protein BXZ70DRAFT_1007369 [Cristinia sonorae]
MSSARRTSKANISLPTRNTPVYLCTRSTLIYSTPKPSKALTPSPTTTSKPEPSNHQPHPHQNWCNFPSSFSEIAYMREFTRFAGYIRISPVSSPHRYRISFAIQPNPLIAISILRLQPTTRTVTQPYCQVVNTTPIPSLLPSPVSYPSQHPHTTATVAVVINIPTHTLPSKLSSAILLSLVVSLSVTPSNTPIPVVITHSTTTSVLPGHASYVIFPLSSVLQPRHFSANPTSLLPRYTTLIAINISTSSSSISAEQLSPPYMDRSSLPLLVSLLFSLTA